MNSADVSSDRAGGALALVLRLWWSYGESLLKDRTHSDSSRRRCIGDWSRATLQAKNGAAPLTHLRARKTVSRHWRGVQMGCLHVRCHDQNCQRCLPVTTKRPPLFKFESSLNACCEVGLDWTSSSRFERTLGAMKPFLCNHGYIWCGDINEAVTLTMKSIGQKIDFILKGQSCHSAHIREI